MRSFTYVITDRAGIHARPAGIFVKEAKKFGSEISVGKGESKADGKNLMQIMSLGVKSGDEISVTVSGEDEADACAAVEAVLKANL